MRLKTFPVKKPRIEMLALIDIVFLLLVVFIYAMFSMAVHHGLPVLLPKSSTAVIEKESRISITVKKDGSIYVDKAPVALARLTAVLKNISGSKSQPKVLVFGHRDLPYQILFRVLDRIRLAGIDSISLQAEIEAAP